MKEKIAEYLHFHDWDCETGMAYNYGTSGDWGEQDEVVHKHYLKLADQILALFPQDEGGLISSDTVNDLIKHCPEGVSSRVSLIIRKVQFNIDQQHEALALKEQMERVMDKLPEVARQQISQKHSLWFDDVDSTEIDELVDAIVEALKAELEG